jgi:hypothetical protein
MSPSESFQEIARLMALASETLDAMAPTAAQLEVLACVIQAHAHAINQASLLSARERAGSLAAMACPTETLN